ncbi:MAG: hypothetical protein LBB74_10030 [Chitinispirillales bacterium]|jgi:hypothetical protein|nr:hypothetical protein [Chitinispirillales bacterium]
MRYAPNIPEEELKNRVGKDFFDRFDYQGIKGKIDFAVKPKRSDRESILDDEYYLWAEAKAAATDILIMLTQLILTIGKARTFDAVNPPHFLSCFDREKIAFVPYHDIMDVFSLNDFNWKVAPSNRETKEFKLVHSRISAIINGVNTYTFNFAKDEKELREFIKSNFAAGKESVAKIQINKNNFKRIYDRWVTDVMPTINVIWPAVKKAGILDCDFYLADLLSANNQTIREKLSVLLNSDRYRYNKQMNETGIFSWEADFVDCQKAHKRFWAKYERPPKEEYWDYIIERRDLLVPQDVRERKGAFFTPPQWVAKAHDYLANVFGEDWQDEYYVWDNSAGTGNLLNGLVNKDNLWASTLDKADVDVMHDRIENGANLWKEQVFQFDFLNDEFLPESKGGKLPDGLFEIISVPKKRKKLIFLINPPYGEAGNAKTRARKGSDNEAEHKAGVKESRMSKRFHGVIGGAALNEKYVQFFARICADVPDCKMAAFVTPKYVCGPNMNSFRNFWKAQYLGGFATPATTHDNCSGDYPICLFIWDLARKNKFPAEVPCDIFNANEDYEGVKVFRVPEDKTINDFMRQYKLPKSEISKKNYIGIARCDSPDSQRNSYCWIALNFNTAHSHILYINDKNLIPFTVYFAVRHVIEHTWLNDSDRYFFPKKEWEKDKTFQNDCFAYTLFHNQNKIKSREGTNHWIPFTEEEVGCKKRFKSRFMTDFIAGRKDNADYVLAEPSSLYGNSDEAYCIIAEPLPLYGSFLDVGGLGGGSKPPEPLKFSREASAVFKTGLELWRYYHKQPKANVNASFYDIREHFKGKNDKGRMGGKSTDERYNELIGILREKLKILAKKIEPKVYEYGFLMA